MKKAALLAAAAALIAASPAAANGYLGAHYTTGEVEFGGPDADLNGWQGEGEFGWSSGGFGAQVGGAFGNFEVDGDDSDVWLGNVHLYWDTGSWKIGGVIAHSDIDELDDSETAYGVEAMVDVSPSANIWSSLTFSSFDFLADFDAWNLDAGANFYAGPNVRFGGYIGTGNIDAGGGADFDTLSFGINTEFQPWSAPVSIALGYHSFDLDDLDFGSSAFKVGARWNFGGGTLQDRNASTPFTSNGGTSTRIFGVY